jgi:D-beta-D-heptose 7-phosphate kinase / D-beta-D-heptose 1-phosphate adenosyltransferase
MVDVYHLGSVERISPEAPVPVFVEKEINYRRGGADNVAHQLQALGVLWYAYFPPKPWEEKHRYMVGQHQLFRRDVERRYHAEHTGDPVGYQAAVLSDYAKGWISVGVAQKTISSCAITVVDPKGSDWRKYEGCTVICPNEKEYDSWDKQGEFPRILVKRGARGMELIEGEHCVHIKTCAKHVYDVTGAGDAVVALMAAALGAGADLVDAASLASIAAGYVVGEVGTAVCTIEKLRELLP